MATLKENKFIRSGISDIIKRISPLSKFDLQKTQSVFPLGKTNGQRGFTLIELIIYIGLLTVMVLVLTEIFLTILDNQSSSQDTSNVAADGRYIYSRFIYDVNRAELISSPSTYSSPSASMTLVINGQNYTYSLSSNNLTLTDPSGVYRLNGQGTVLTTLSFTKVGTTSAKPTMQMSFVIKGITPINGVINQEAFQTTAGLR